MGEPAVQNIGFFSEEKEDMHFIHFPMKLDKSLEINMTTELKTWLLKPQVLHVFDLTGIIEIPQFALRLLLSFSSELKKNEKYLVSLNVTNDLKKFLTDNGMKTSFNPIKTIDEGRTIAKLDIKNKPHTIDTQFINPFIDGTKVTLETQAKVTTEPLKPYIKAKGEVSDTDIAGVINIACPQFNGTIALCFPKATFLGVYEKMLGEKHTDINDEVKDAAGEFLNIIFGHAKRILVAKGYQLEKAIPTILVGKGVDVRFNHESPTIMLPFKTNVGNFHIELILIK
jgi:chemotaxis protein CheX